MYGNQSSSQKSFATTQRNVFTTNNFENYGLKAPDPLYGLIFLMSYVSRIYSYVICMSFVCTRLSSICHSYVLVCHPYVTRMHSYVIRMSLVCTPMSSICHSNVLACHSYVARMYAYPIRMPVVCTRMSLVCTCLSSVCHSYVTRMLLVCTRMSFVCHLYVLVSHPYVTGLWFYHESLRTLNLHISAISRKWSIPR